MQLPLGDDTDVVGYGADDPVFWINRIDPHSAKQHTPVAEKACAPPSRTHLRMENA